MKEKLNTFQVLHLSLLRCWNPRLCTQKINYPLCILYFALPLIFWSGAEAVVICGGSWVIFKPSTTHPSGSDTGFHWSLITLKRAIWLVARLLGSHSSLKAVSTTASHLFHTILTSFLFSAGHRHYCFYHFQSSSPRTLRNIFPLKAKWRSEIIL